MKKAFIRTLVVLFSVAGALVGVDLLVGLVNPSRFTPKIEFPFQKPALYRLSKVKELGYELRAETKVDVAGIEYRINRLGFRDIEHRFLKTENGWLSWAIRSPSATTSPWKTRTLINGKSTGGRKTGRFHPLHPRGKRGGP